MISIVLSSLYIFIALLSAYLIYFVVVKEFGSHHVAVVSGFGGKQVVGPGKKFLPFCEEIARFDKRSEMMGLLVPEVFTKDGLKLNLSGYAYYKITNPLRLTRNYSLDLRKQLVDFSRKVCSSLEASKLLKNPSLLSNKLFFMLNNEVKGMVVLAVQVDRIKLSEEIFVQGSEQYSILLNLARGQSGYGAEKIKNYLELIVNTYQDKSIKVTLPKPLNTR
ncbi:MAG: SPFH domain-containing protein [Nanoarchaeota archaeon]|nr:SPFH domain-containing protein [Nanoarchaeota archaeon]